MRWEWGWLRTRDPHWASLRRAVRPAVVVPANFAVGSQLIGDAQVATFAAFGSFAMLLFANFPGGRRARLAAYLLLAGVGAGLIALGSAVASPDWLAVVMMAVVAFVVLFAGVVSSVVNGGVQAALLAFILAVLLPGGVAATPHRLAGWGLAAAVSIPVAVLVWPPGDRNLLRAAAGRTCRALAGMLRLTPPEPGAGDPLVALRRAARELRTAFRTSAANTSALSTGSRLVVRLADELEWLATLVGNACADEPTGWSEQGRRLRTTAAEALDACAAALTHDASRSHVRAELAGWQTELAKARRAVADEALDRLRAATGSPTTGSPTTGSPTDGSPTDGAGEFGRPLYAAHELGYAIALVVSTVQAIADADSRSWWNRLAGRRAQPSTAFGAVAAAQQVAAGHVDRHSVWLQNSIRGAAGLALAVLLARVVDAQNAFWIGLGALSVIRSNALSTGATVARALAGTALGFAVGGALVAAIGTSPPLLWTLLPVAILVAASAPALISFIAGQAAFTVFTIILFNIIAPAGWRIGVVRVEDVALGCAASLVAGALFWPRGAGQALGAAYAEAYRSAAEFLRQSIGSVSGRPVRSATAAAANAAGMRLDDALRQYLAEQGAKHVPLASVTTLANAATRLRLAGVAIAALATPAPAGQQVDGPAPTAATAATAPGATSAAPADGRRLAAAAAVLDRRTTQVTDWYRALADGFARRDAPLPPGCEPAAAESFLDVVVPAVDGCGDPGQAVRAQQLLWSGQYLGDVDVLRPGLLALATEVRAAQAIPWWRR
ncbi:FUSC family protein [uncultured Jatrophihabitans sp.]|uniref:FUSC family protein n=1 Tax=uncultured Jatrophihabitans sp. TaxID=1610747 RepID=UPI0035C99E85